jgi:pantothenate kinase-related protein Tda10
MSIDDEIELEHLLFFDRKCRVCDEVKSLIDDFYLTRKDRKTLASSYSYECKVCTVKRVSGGRKSNLRWEYPDW